VRCRPAAARPTPPLPPVFGFQVSGFGFRFSVWVALSSSSSFPSPSSSACAPQFPSRVHSAHMRESRPDSGLAHSAHMRESRPDSGRGLSQVECGVVEQQLAQPLLLHLRVCVDCLDESISQALPRWDVPPIRTELKRRRTCPPLAAERTQRAPQPPSLVHSAHMRESRPDCGLGLSSGQGHNLRPRPEFTKRFSGLSSSRSAPRPSPPTCIWVAGFGFRVSV